jgi:hypothetical protein
MNRRSEDHGWWSKACVFVSRLALRDRGEWCDWFDGKLVADQIGKIGAEL